MLQLLGLSTVLDGNEGFEGGLVIEPFVFVHFVRPNRRLDRRVELHPLHVAVVIIVRAERRGTRLEKCFERWLRGGVRRGPQVLRRNRELALVFGAVRHRDEAAVRTATNGREEARRSR